MTDAVLIERLAADNMTVPMILHCPMCSDRHIDEGDFATKPQPAASLRSLANKEMGK